MIHSNFVSLLSCWFTLGALAGCASDPDSGPEGGAGTGAAGATAGTGGAGSGGGSAAAGGVLGGFAVRMVAADPVLGSEAFSSFSGTVYDSFIPEDAAWAVEAESGDCELLVPRRALCTTPCGSGSVCIGSEMCVPMASTVDVGSVRLEGVGSTPITVEAGANNYYQIGSDVMLPYPPAADGAPVSISATGGSFGAFTIQSEGIAPLALTIPDPLPVAPNQAVRLTWTPGTSDATRIHVTLDVSHHGGTKGKIVCDTADSGSLEISAMLVTDLLDLGLAGFPTIDIGRRAAGTARVARGEVELAVAHDVKRIVSIPGLTSCNDDTECSTGQTCVDLRCQ